MLALKQLRTVNPPFPLPHAFAWQEVERLKQEVMEHLRQLAHTPSVQMHHLPPKYEEYQVDDDDPSGALLRNRMGKYAREHGIIASDLD